MTWAPWLWIPPQLAHDLSPYAVGPMSRLRFRQRPYTWNAFDWKGLHFPNRLGIAGGVDKDGIGARGWWRFGAGFIEVGTVTPAPQKANPGLKVLRDNDQKILWNQLGFPSQGSIKVRERLMQISEPRPAPLFLNIGKNRSTSLEEAHLDYHMLIDFFSEWVDGFVINVSSPNTQGLRQLLDPENFKKFMGQLQTPLLEAKKPCLLKLSPDLEDEDLYKILDAALDFPIDGFVLTNTTLARPDGDLPKHGGVSGRFLARRSKEVLKKTRAHLMAQKKTSLLVSVGGIMTPLDVQERLDLGADLVQIYSTLIFEGPNFFKRVARWQQEQK